MRGSDAVSGSLFSYIDLEDRVPVKHPLWLVLEIVNEALLALDAEFAKMYAALGRPSIPPERLLRGSLLQAFYTIRSERQLMEQLDYNLLFRWFVGLAATRSIVKSRRRRRGGALSAFFQSEMGRRGTSESAVSMMRKAELGTPPRRPGATVSVEPGLRSGVGNQRHASGFADAMIR